MKKSTKIYTSITVVIVLLIIGYLIFGRRNGTAINVTRTVTAERGDIVQDVSFSGNVKSPLSSDLSFELAGTVKNIFVDSGDVVTKGQKLAQIDVRSAQLQLAQARAQRVATQDQTLISSQKAEQDYTNTKKLNEKTILKYRLAVVDAKAAFEQAGDAYNATRDEYGDESSTAKTKYSTVLSAETTYHNAQKVYSEQKDSLLNSTYDSQKTAELARAQYQASVQASLNTPGLSAVQASENLAALALAKSTLTAPFDGIIASRDINEGELASASKPILSIQGNGVLEVTANVPETDAMKIKVDQKATVTFDAFPSTEQYPATVTRVAPAAKVIGGVPTFEIRLKIDNLSEKIKAGLTANVIVHAAKKENVVGVQRRAIITRDEKQYVKIVDTKGTETEREVVTGLLGSNGTIEVVSGLNSGDKVIVSTVK
ncbi:MAG: efflux RND transporter periplasmic adaptor subunit [bacterium]|nr:efflux RND transporter periplasmic adaptor subunit [bacterium]